MKSKLARVGVYGLTLFLFAIHSHSELAPSLQIRTQGDQVQLSWNAAWTGAVYTVQSASRLTIPDWQPVGGDANWPISATEWTGPKPSGGTTFYRLLVTLGAQRGTIETNALLRGYTAVELGALLARYFVPGVTPVPVEAWRVVYSTVDAHGGPTRASALVVVPNLPGTSLPIVSYQHGTVTQRENVPSRLNTEADLGLILGAARYIAVLPDYLGLGDSPGAHPYHHARSEATAVVDALRAAREMLTSAPTTWNGQLFLVGYSQGGHATLAAHREIQSRHSDEFTITASAPGAGAYDLSGVSRVDFLSTRTPPTAYYYPYLIHAYAGIYDEVAPVTAWFVPPYDTTIPPLFDGTHGGGEIDDALPDRPKDILKPEVLVGLETDPLHPLRQVLVENDVHTGWFPQAPTRLYHCRGDQDVIFANSQVAFDSFKAAGAPAVELIDPLPIASHTGCVPFALLGAKLWFDSLRQ